MKKLTAGIFSLLSVCCLVGLPMQSGIQAAEKESFWSNPIVYFTITDRFYDGNPANNNSYGRPTVDATESNIGTFHGGDIAGLTKKINEGYFTDLGINAIWFTSPYEQIHGFVGGGGEGDFAHYAYHGYWVLDYTAMDRNMGTVAEMREFVEAAHRKNIRVIMDVVLNHAGYNNIKDMLEYGYGYWKDGKAPSANWKPSESDQEGWHAYHDLFIDYTDEDGEDAWEKWWGSGWIRAGIAGYTPSGSDELTRTLDYMPDFKTEVTEDQGLPPIMVTKWGKEKGGDYDKYILPSEKELRKDLKIAPAEYQIKWLAAWVEEFGIDGFRCDTAKHVDIERWAELKKACSASLEKWRKANTGKPGASWTDPFWMTGEVWNHGVKYDEYYDNGFDSIINFEFIGTDLLGPSNKPADVLDQAYADYSKALRSEDHFDALSYISSHDTNLYPRKDLMRGMTNLLLCPGGVQIYYGDETARPEGEECSDLKQGTRSDMNWKSIDKKLFEHSQKLIRFRTANIAVAKGEHKKIKSQKNGYAFTRVYKGNKVAVVVEAKGATDVDVSSLWKDGTAIRNAYSGTEGVVKKGKAVFDAGTNGVILIEEKK